MSLSYCSLILKQDNTLWSCGWNYYGQLGNGTTNNINTGFTQVATDVKQIACGGHHTLILKQDDSVWSCGYNRYGQLGHSTNIYYSNPNPNFIQVATDVKQVACGGLYSFILKQDDSVWSCGYNRYGQLGHSNCINTTSPNLLTQVATDVKQVACGDHHSLILKQDNTLWSCGNNKYGQLGHTTNNNTDNPNPNFTQVATDVKQIACGAHHTLILKQDDSVWSCGYNRFGQLGHSNCINTTSPNLLTQVATDVKQVACGDHHSLILKQDDSVWSCGYNRYGQLGNGTNGNSANPNFTQVLTDVKQIACGAYYSLIIKQDNILWSCGNNKYGQLGHTTNNNTDNPNPNFTQVLTDTKQLQDVITLVTGPNAPSSLAGQLIL